MERLTDVLFAAFILCPFVAVYFSGVLVRVNRDNSQQPRNKRVKFQLAHAGEALPGLFEMVVTLAAIFGVVFQTPDATPRFQLMGIIASAGFLAFRGGYTYQESLLAVKHSPGSQIPAVPLKD